MSTVRNLREFKGEIGADVLLGVSPDQGYVVVHVRTRITDKRVAEPLRLLREAFRAIALEATQAAVNERITSHATPSP